MKIGMRSYKLFFGQWRLAERHLLHFGQKRIEKRKILVRIEGKTAIQKIENNPEAYI